MGSGNPGEPAFLFALYTVCGGVKCQSKKESMWLAKTIIYWLMGLLASVIGTAIIVWVLYNVFIEVQPEYTGPTLIASLGSFGISIPMVGIGIYWFKRGYQHLTR
jgi:type IV secretory pathway TrbL component